jgi:hypothetical protein
MQFPISDMGRRFLVMTDPREKVDFETKQPVMKDGQQVMTVTLLIMGEGEAVQTRVSVTGDPGVSQGQWVTPVGLALNAIDRRDGMMTWWSVERLDVVTGEPVAAGRARKAAEA